MEAASKRIALEHGHRLDFNLIAWWGQFGDADSGGSGIGLHEVFLPHFAIYGEVAAEVREVGPKDHEVSHRAAGLFEDDFDALEGLAELRLHVRIVVSGSLPGDEHKPLAFGEDARRVTRIGSGSVGWIQ